VIGQFIGEFNNNAPLFITFSTLEALDINLYCSDFGNIKLSSTIANLSDQQYKVFLVMNRLSVILLAYGDSWKRLLEDDEDANQYGGDMIQPSIMQLVENTSITVDVKFKTTYANYFLQLANGKMKANFADPRSTTPDHDRNDAMQYHTLLAAKVGENALLAALSHVLVSNYFALEAYVPVGAILDIFRLQGANVGIPMTQNYYIDSLLMNFAYAIDHYYHFLHGADAPTANKYYAKYVARIFEVTPKITVKEFGECWTTAVLKYAMLPANGPIVDGNIGVNSLKKTYMKYLNGINSKLVVVRFAKFAFTKCMPLTFQLFWDKNGNRIELDPLSL